MPELISEPTMIPVPGGKSIAEYIGRVKTGDNDVSVAVMHAPAGWSEPAQAPNFDGLRSLSLVPLMSSMTARPQQSVLVRR